MPSEQPPTRVHECPTCGSPVEVVSSDEGTHHYRPAPSEQPREGTREQANGLKQLYEVDGIFLGKCKNITLYQCENVAINSSANVNIGDCMIEHLTHNNIEHEQDNLHKSPAPEGEGEAG